MKVRLTLLWERVRSSYWFIPMLMLASSTALALLLVAVDQKVETAHLRGLWWIFSGGAEGARSLLSTVAGSVIGVAGTTFSITIAVLSLTSSQFGPRLLRGFLSDTANQVVLGTFVGTFLYCLLVLRTVRSVEEITFIPHLAVTGGVALAIASVLMLIFFIHHVSNSIQASEIIANVSTQLGVALERLFPEKIGEGEDAVPEPSFPVLSGTATAARARDSGYVQAVDGDALLSLAGEKDLVLDLRRTPGQFVARGSTLALVYGSNKEEDDISDRINAAFSLGNQRTATQDATFLVLQLVEIAVRALSPGINDPFTAIMCIDRLGDALCYLAGRKMPSSLRHDGDGVLRVVARPLTFEYLVSTAFDEIHHCGRNDPLVAKRLNDVLMEIEECSRSEAQKEAVARMVARYDSRSESPGTLRST